GTTLRDTKLPEQRSPPVLETIFTVGCHRGEQGALLLKFLCIEGEGKCDASRLFEVKEPKVRLWRTGLPESEQCYWPMRPARVQCSVRGLGGGFSRLGELSALVIGAARRSCPPAGARAPEAVVPLAPATPRACTAVVPGKRAPD
ncbi:hypothetical protein NDU88_008492, partial [Pleurodeles waltl]